MPKEELTIKQIEGLIAEAEANKLPENWLWHYDKVERVIKLVNAVRLLQLPSSDFIELGKTLFENTLSDLTSALKQIQQERKQKPSAKRQKGNAIIINGYLSDLISRLFNIRNIRYSKRYNLLANWGMRCSMNINLARFLVTHWESTKKLEEKATDDTSHYALFEFGLPALSDIINEKTWPRVIKVFYYILNRLGTKSDFVFKGLDEVHELLTQKNWIKFVKGFIIIRTAIKQDETIGCFFQGFKYLKKIIKEDNWKAMAKNITAIIETNEPMAFYIFSDCLCVIRTWITVQNWPKIYNAIIKAEKEYPNIFLTERGFRDWCAYILQGGASKEEFVQARLQKKFGLTLRLDAASQEGLAFSDLYSDEVSRIKKLIGTKIKKVFPLGKVYGEARVHGVIELSNPVELVRVLTIVLLTPPKKGTASVQDMLKNPEYGRYINFLRHYSKARTLFDFDKLHAAREYILKSDINLNKVFNDIKYDFEAVKTQKSAFAAERIVDYLAKFSQRGSGKASALADIVLGVKALFHGTLKFNHVILKMQEGTISDIFDSERLMCCAFYPNGLRKSASIDYLKDPYTGLLQLKAVIKSPFKPLKDAGIISVAILMVCRNENNKTVLLVDSVEGNSDYWGCMKEREWFNLMYKGILQVKDDIKADYIVFNKDVHSATPKIFNNYLQKKGLPLRNVNITKLGRTLYSEMLYAAIYNIPQGFCIK